jgi:hypothetical protein
MGDGTLLKKPFWADSRKWYQLKRQNSHAEDGGDILEGMHARGCTAIEDSRIRGKSGRARGLGTVSATSPDPAGIVSKGRLVAPT